MKIPDPASAPLPSYAQLAGMIDHALLHPTLSLAQMRAGCELAAGYEVATVCVKPYAVHGAAEVLRGSRTGVSTVIGFPHGGMTMEAKCFEVELACGDGAVEIDAVINLGQVASGEWTFVEREIAMLSSEAHRHGALIKIILETGLLPDDETKRRLCQIGEAAKVDFVKTSTGFGYVTGGDGRLVATGATEHDVALMRAACSPQVGVKASGGVRDLATMLRMRELGATRCGTSATKDILDAARAGGIITPEDGVGAEAGY